MGILDRFVKAEVLQRSPERIKREEEAEAYEELQREQAASGGGNPCSAGQPLPPPSTGYTPPPSLDKETMEIYLRGKLPEKIDNLRGFNRFWPFTYNDYTTEIKTGNLNVSTQRKIKDRLTTAIDFQGTDNTDDLIQVEMIQIHAEVTTGKARSDLADGIRERLVPSVGWNIGQTNYPSNTPNQGERPRESRALFGLFRK